MSDVLINGRRHSFASIKMRIRGTERKCIKEINYSDNLDQGEERGTGPEKLGKTRGDYKAEADCTFFKKEHVKLVAEFGDGFMEEDFDIVVTYVETPGDGVTTDVIVGCNIAGNDAKNSQGTDPSTVACKLNPTWIKWNGKKPLKNMQV
jgi:hypothetical protein